MKNPLHRKRLRCILNSIDRGISDAADCMDVHQVRISCCLCFVCSVQFCMGNCILVSDLACDPVYFKRCLNLGT